MDEHVVDTKGQKKQKKQQPRKVIIRCIQAVFTLAVLVALIFGLIRAFAKPQNTNPEPSLRTSTSQTGNRPGAGGSGSKITAATGSLSPSIGNQQNQATTLDTKKLGSPDEKAVDETGSSTMIKLSVNAEEDLSATVHTKILLNLSSLTPKYTSALLKGKRAMEKGQKPF